LTHSPVAMVVFDGLSSSKTELQSPQNWNMKHYKTVMFVQISKCQAPLAYKTFWWRFCCHTKLYISHFSGNNG